MKRYLIAIIKGRKRFYLEEKWRAGNFFGNKNVGGGQVHFLEKQLGGTYYYGKRWGGYFFHRKKWGAGPFFDRKFAQNPG